MTEPTNEPTPATEPQPIPADVRRFVEMARDWFDDDYPICEFADKWTQVSGKWEPDMFHSEAARILALLDAQPASVDPFREELACLRVETLEHERDQLREALADCEKVAFSQGKLLCDAVDAEGVPYQSKWLADILAGLKEGA